MPRNKYPEETVKTILDAALKLFIEKGYEQTTILDIVGGMKGLTRGAFYHHFKSKEEVLFALVENMFNNIDPFKEVKSRTDLNGLEKIKFALSELNKDEEFVAIQLQLLPLLNSPTYLKRVIEDHRDSAAPMLAELIEEGVRDGSLKVKYPKLAAEVFVLLANFWMLPTLYPSKDKEEAMQRVEMLKCIIDFLGLPIINEVDAAKKEEAIFLYEDGKIKTRKK